jgi:plasmid maintenance system killer protein
MSSRSSIIYIIGACALVLIAILYTHNTKLSIESFTTIPDMNIPAKSTKSTKSDDANSQQSDTLNGYWRIILAFLSQHPDKAAPFIADVQDKFFHTDCPLKSPKIDFGGLADAYRPVFN